MSLQKLVDGRLVDMSPSEEAAILADWAASDAAALAQAAHEIGKNNVGATAERAKADAIAEVERKIAAGASQSEINQTFLQFLKEQL